MTLGRGRQNGIHQELSLIYCAIVAAIAMTADSVQVFAKQESVCAEIINPCCNGPQTDDACLKRQPVFDGVCCSVKPPAMDAKSTTAYFVGDLLDAYASHVNMETRKMAKESFRSSLEAIVFNDPNWYEKTADGKFAEYRSDSNLKRLVWTEEQLILSATEYQHRSFENALRNWRIHGFENRFLINCQIMGISREIAQKIGAIKQDEIGGKDTTTFKRVSGDEIDQIGKTLADSASTKILMAPRMITSMNLEAGIDVGDRIHTSISQTEEPSRTLYQSHLTGQSLRMRVLPSRHHDHWVLELNYASAEGNPVQPAAYNHNADNPNVKSDLPAYDWKGLQSGCSLQPEQLAVLGVEAPVGADHDFEVLLIAYRKIEGELSERAETPVTLISNIANSMADDSGATDRGSQD